VLCSYGLTMVGRHILAMLRYWYSYDWTQWWTTVTDEVLKAVLPSLDGEYDKKSGQDDSAVVDQYKKIIREQVYITILLYWLCENKVYLTFWWRCCCGRCHSYFELLCICSSTVQRWGSLSLFFLMCSWQPLCLFGEHLLIIAHSCISCPSVLRWCTVVSV